MEDHVHSENCNHDQLDHLASNFSDARQEGEAPTWVTAGTPVPQMSDADRKRMDRNRRKATKRKAKAAPSKPQEKPQDRTRRVVRQMRRKQAQTMRRINKLGTQPEVRGQTTETLMVDEAAQFSK